MELRNGDVGYFRSRDWRRVWLTGLFAWFVNHATYVFAFCFFIDLAWRGYDFNPSPAAMILLIPLLAIPAAVYYGLRVWDWFEVWLGAWVGASLGILPMCAEAHGAALLIAVVNTISFLAIASSVFFLWRHSSTRTCTMEVSYSSLKCVKCGYWLCGLNEQRCPECGTSFGRQSDR